MSKSLYAAVISGVVGATTLMAGSAQAHIRMFGEVQDRGGDQKTQPCGGVNRSATPFVFEPGATVQLGVEEFVAHDGYFRIAFDDDGQDDFKDPVSIDPVRRDRYGDAGPCKGTPDDRCGESDFCNVVSRDGGATVLWDNLDPHAVETKLSEQKWSWRVTLPDVECDNCTLQVMQVMEDHLGDAHGPFDGQKDLYYRCVDIVLKKGAGKTPGTVALKGEEPEEKLENEGIDCRATGVGGALDGGASSGDGADAGVQPDAGRTEGGAQAYVEGDVSLDEAAGGSVEEGGCSVAPGTRAGGWSFAALALMTWTLVRRRRGRDLA